MLGAEGVLLWPPAVLSEARGSLDSSAVVERGPEGVVLERGAGGLLAADLQQREQRGNVNRRHEYIVAIHDNTRR